MSKTLKWVIIALIIAAITLLIYLAGVYYGKTLGPIPTFLIWTVICVIGWKWTHPKGERSDDEDSVDSER